jgi:hypothetical protein
VQQPLCQRIELDLFISLVVDWLLNCLKKGVLKKTITAPMNFSG